jgi:hypothetical protein
MKNSAPIYNSSFTAVVHAIDGVRFVASAPSPEGLAAQIVGYVAERCEFVLWPRIAAQVRALIDAANHSAAIALYFAHVGERWDEERLELDGLSRPVASLNCVSHGC